MHGEKQDCLFTDAIRQAGLPIGVTGADFKPCPGRPEKRIANQRLILP
jgi:hypothetical protein